MVTYNDLEHVLDLFISTLTTTNIHKFAINLSLSFRCDLALALIDDGNHDPKIQKDIEKSFQRIHALSNYRNLIAHNAPMTSIYMDDQMNLGLRVELRDRKNKSSELTIDQVQKATVDAFELGMILLKQLGELNGYARTIPSATPSLLGTSALDTKE